MKYNQISKYLDLSIRLDHVISCFKLDLFLRRVDLEANWLMNSNLELKFDSPRFSIELVDLGLLILLAFVRSEFQA